MPVNDCDNWQIQQASYDLATYRVPVPAEEPDELDNRQYECTAGYRLRVDFTSKFYTGYDYDDVSSGGASVVLGAAGVAGDGTTNPNVVNDAIDYTSQADTHSGTGQARVYCDPQTTSP
ncbi:MAG TPA: hypothetical protein VME22_13395 [Solirubrobacteraceae bacterium]|nr:hypothetical protein [Solirubrobacteraceae bacterium]